MNNNRIHPSPYEIKLPCSVQPQPGHRDWYLHEAVRSLPRILLMVDKNPFSPSFGSFDREYWHYRTIDFPCGMNQEFTLALAMACTTEHPDNPYFRCDRLKDLVAAGIDFAAESAHSDGTCDDYFPNEKALGALVFSLYAMAESCRILGLANDSRLAFFRKRASWLLNNNESGQLANHQALAALALQTVYELIPDPCFRKGSDQFRDLTLSWQNPEGWFQEYEGADPGYHSCSIAFLAKLRQKTSDPLLTQPLLRAVAFARWFMHPDGSYAGEYGSRNTYHFYPHGFELLAKESPEALEIAELYLRKGLPARTRYFNDDNRMCSHYVYDWFQAWRDHASLPDRSSLDVFGTEGIRYFEQARLFVKRSRERTIVVATSKGGVVKVTGSTGPLYSDTGVMIRSSDRKVLVSHLVDKDSRAEVDLEKGSLRISGSLFTRRSPLMTPLKHMIFRILVLTIGRFNPCVFRLLIQKLFIVGKLRTASTFSREIHINPDGLTIKDSISLTKNVKRPLSVLTTPDATSIYVANSNTYQATNLLPVRPLKLLEAELNQSGTGSEKFHIRWNNPTEPMA